MRKTLFFHAGWVSALSLFPRMSYAQEGERAPEIPYENLPGMEAILQLGGVIFHWLLIIGLVIAPIVVLYAGFLFLTGGTNPENISKAKQVLLYAIIGLVVIILSGAVVNIVRDLLVV
ncbi:MAG: hypothetical protein HYV77_01615 [Candidatus Wildermuthbacteria bacterium]|nr:hypothetical protein [Candidatus Wildermuthbacteria bacterium]